MHWLCNAVFALDDRNRFSNKVGSRIVFLIRLDSRRGSHVASVAKVTWCVVLVIIGPWLGHPLDLDLDFYRDFRSTLKNSR